MADELKEEFSADITFEKGRGGVFDVRLEGEMVFSKHTLGRFPEAGEIQTLLRKHSA